MAKRSHRARRPLRPSATQKQSSINEVDNNELQARIGLAVRVVRTARGLSQKKLAERIGKSQNFIWMLENGKSDPGIVLLQTLARALNVDISLFLAPVLSPKSTSSDAEQKVFEVGQDFFLSLLQSVDKRLTGDGKNEGE